MLATLGAKPFSREGWLFEIKYDGVRVLAAVGDDTVSALRAERPGDHGALPGGGRRACRASRRPLPHRRRDRRARRGRPAELSAAAGADGAHEPARRRARGGAQFRSSAIVLRLPDAGRLRPAARFRSPRSEGVSSRCSCRRSVAVRYGDHVPTEGEAFFEAARTRGSKASSPRRRAASILGRSIARLDQDQVPAPPGVRDRRLHRSAGRRARTSARFTSDSTTAGARLRLQGRHRIRRGDAREACGRRSGRCARPTSPFAVGGPAGRGHHWVEPRLVCEVRFTEWTDDGGLRHPTFLGLRGQATRGLPA